MINKTIYTARLLKHQMLQAHRQNRDAKIEYYSTLLKKLKNELAKRDFANFTPDKLLSGILNCENELRKLTFTQTFGGDNIINWDTIEPTFIFNPED